VFQRDEEAFHSKGSISQAMQMQRQAMQVAINHLQETYLKSMPLDKAAEDMAGKYAICIPVLDEGAIQPERREVDIDPSRNRTHLPYHSGRGAVVKGTEISISVPFQGDAEVFRLHASSYTIESPQGRIAGSAIVFRAQGTNLDPAQVRRQFDDWLAAIKRHLAGMSQELGAFNEILRGQAMTMLTARLDKLKRDDDLLTGLGFGSSGAVS